MKRLPLAAVLLFIAGWNTPVLAQSCGQGSICINADRGDDALSRQIAQERKEEWAETRSLRQKQNKRIEKEFDKADKAIDNQENCETSADLNAYWEPNTRRCLDRNTGRPL